MAITEGADHQIRDANPAFCELIGRSREELLEKPFCGLLPDGHKCQTQLDAVFTTGKPIAPPLDGQAHTPLAFCSFAVWPVITDGRNTGALLQVTGYGQLQERTVAMNEALLLGSLRQHELVAAANDANVRLQAEILQRMQSEADALMLTKEISHRIKNNLQMVIALIAREMKDAPPKVAERYAAVEMHILAITRLYDLISQSGQKDKIDLGAYLCELARSIRASLLESGSAIRIEVEPEHIEIESDRAVAFGLLVNELSTNAVKHAFPRGVGRVTLKIEKIGCEIELTVDDDGVGIQNDDRPTRQGRHGSDYVAIFVRQLGGKMTVSSLDGTTIRIRFPSALPTE